MTYIVEAVDEALGLLMLVAGHPSLGVTELARRAGLTKARAFRLLTTLEHRGLIARESPAAVYKLSYNALLVGNAAREQFDLVKLVAPRLAAIGAPCGENVIVRVRDGLESVCVARHESTQSVRVHTEIGNRRPLHVGASGKLLLAFAAPEVLDACWRTSLNASPQRPSSNHKPCATSSRRSAPPAMPYRSASAMPMPFLPPRRCATTAARQWRR